MSEIGEDPYNQASGSKGKGADPFIHEVKVDKPFGAVVPLADPRMIRYDRLAARSAPPVRWHVTKDDRMPAEEVGRMFEALYKAYGIVGAAPSDLEAFHEAINFCHTINSGSVLQPGRSVVIIRGNRLSYATVLEVLGNQLRQFYRALANEVRETNRRVLEGVKNKDDIEAQEKYAWLMEVASDRGLLRHPDLCHDSSSAVWTLRPHERAALESSKAGVFSTLVNNADAMKVFRPTTREAGETSIYSQRAPEGLSAM